MARTPRWGLEYFGAGISGSLDGKGAKFTRADRLIIDRVLAALEAHDHGGGERLADPAVAPSATLNVGGGTLAGGNTYHYVVTYVDQFGLETAPSDEVSVVAPSKVAIPPVPGVNTVSGGTLDTGLYMYGVTAHDSVGETPLSSLATVTISDWKTVEVTPVMPVGATQISIWRQGPLDSGFTRLVTQSTDAVFADDGSIPPEPCATDPDKAPPSVNTTGSSASITITPDAAEITEPTLVERWRIYRTTSSGAYGAQSLLFEAGTSTTEFVDDGSVAQSTGIPPIASRTLTPSAAIASRGVSGSSLLLRSPGGTIWRVTATRDGVIDTRQFPVPAGSESFFADAGVSLYDSTDAIWRLTVSDSGAVSTATAAGETAGETNFGYGQGPELPTVDGAVFWKLGVDTDGALVTQGQDDSTVLEGFGTRKVTVGSTPPANPEDGEIFIDESGFTSGWNTATVQVYRA